MPNYDKDLFYLEELSDYEVASDYSDVRGWNVIDADKRTIGKVTNLLVSKKEERVVYLDVEVDTTLLQVGYDALQIPASEGVHGFINKEGDDHLILPVGMVNLDEDQKQVLTNRINYTTFTSAKRFRKGADIDREYELSLFRHYIGDEAIENKDQDDFYNRKEFENVLRPKRY